MTATSTWRLIATVGLASALVLVPGSSVIGQSATPQGGARVRRAPTPQELTPAVEAAFRADSYTPGTVAALRLFNDATGVRLQIYHAGPDRVRTVGTTEMRGVPVSKPFQIGAAMRGRTVSVRVGSWPSGLYFARLEATDGRVGFAPFVVGPRSLGTHRVAVVLPTFTWQAYNIRDDDGDGIGNSWYADRLATAVRLHRPFLSTGVPYGFSKFDLRFLHWLARHGKQVDFLTDGALDRVPDAATLARSYDLIVFPGHHEYVTTHEYDVIEGYRDRGGNLVFLSADNFYWQVVRNGDVLERTQPWRDLGRPEAALIGVQYTSNMPRFGRYVALDTATEPWVFARTGLENGSVFGHGGIEIDAISSSSPRNVKVIARIPNVFGTGRNADMTIYRTRSGGMVFAAGAFTLASASIYPTASRIIENLWAQMTSER